MNFNLIFLLCYLDLLIYRNYIKIFIFYFLIFLFLFLNLLFFVIKNINEFIFGLSTNVWVDLVSKKFLFIRMEIQFYIGNSLLRSIFQHFYYILRRWILLILFKLAYLSEWNLRCSYFTSWKVFANKVNNLIFCIFFGHILNISLFIGKLPLSYINCKELPDFFWELFLINFENFKDRF